MIPDEQIKQLAVSCGFKLTNETGDDLKPYVYEFVRELIALAQQVKSLEFVKTGDYDNSTPPVEHYSATTEFGIIELIVDGDGVVRAGFLDSIVYDRDFTTLTKAIEAANEDYQRRVLSCLVWGGGE